jgi:HD-GYP domain-containing protein (c-di-GMP phosphodiesterase class II)
MIDSVLRNQDAMAWLVYLRKRDEYAYHHSIASSVWAVILGRHLGFDRQGLDTLAIGGMLLDIGKAKLPESLTARDGKLSPAEYEAIKKHVAHGLQMVKLTPGINADVLAMIEGHHERADGTGYPKGLKGADIPVFARIGGLVDCYDAMTSQRPWARAKSPYDAIRELNTLSGVHFQKEMVEQFVQALGMFPTGSVVEFNTGEVGIVVEQNRVRRLRPKVMLVLDAAKQPLAEYRTLDLRKCPSDQNDSGAYWIVGGHETGAFGLDPKNYFLG